MKKRKIAVFGADGFIGSYITEALVVGAEVDVVAFDRFTGGLSRNLEHLRGKIDFRSGDFSDMTDVVPVLKGVTEVFHCISMTTPGSSIDDPVGDMDSNVRNSIRLFQACVDAGVRTVYFPSSGGAIYGNQDCDFFSESDVTLPISPYAISKLAIERYLAYFFARHGLRYVVFRYANPYGIRQNMTGSQGIIPIFLNAILHDEPITVFGDGSSIRDYIFIDDLVRDTLAVMDSGRSCEIFNIGSGRGTSIGELLTIMEDVTGRSLRVVYRSARDTDVKRVVLDISKVRKLAQSDQSTNLREGIEKTWRWVISQRG